MHSLTQHKLRILASNFKIKNMSFSHRYRVDKDTGLTCTRYLTSTCPVKGIH